MRLTARIHRREPTTLAPHLPPTTSSSGEPAQPASAPTCAAPPYPAPPPPVVVPSICAAATHLWISAAAQPTGASPGIYFLTGRMAHEQFRLQRNPVAGSGPHHLRPSPFPAHDRPQNTTSFPSFSCNAPARRRVVRQRPLCLSSPPRSASIYTAA